MRIELLYVDGCPHRGVADARIRAALEAVGMGELGIEHVLVSGQDEAEALGFLGSPSVRIDGADPFAEPGASVALACRLYRTTTGPEGAPSVDQLVRALRDRV
jgi:hypothetical protein